MSFIRKITARIGLGERRKDGRVPVRGLDVSYWTGLEQRRARIKDISPTGIYLLTHERWLPGTSVQLTLQRKGFLDHVSRPQVRLRARTVRLGDDGVGLKFLHEHINDADWIKLMGRATTLVEHSDGVYLFRFTKALAFLLHFAPAGESRILKLITEDLVRERAERAIEIVLKAEEMLTAQGCAQRTGISPDLILRILEDGSKTHQEEMEQSWAGVLASSATEGSVDEDGMIYAELLSKLEASHILILAAGSACAMQMGWKPDSVLPQSLICTADEIKKITGKRDLAVIERDLHHLYELGLLELTVKEIPFTPIEQANITPTTLGMYLYARCSGQIGVSETSEIDNAAMEIAS